MDREWPFAQSRVKRLRQKSRRCLQRMYKV